MAGLPRGRHGFEMLALRLVPMRKWGGVRVGLLRCPVHVVTPPSKGAVPGAMGLSGSPLLPASVGTLATMCVGVSRSGWRKAGTRVMVSGGIALRGLCVHGRRGRGPGGVPSPRLHSNRCPSCFWGNHAVETKYPHEAAYDAFLCGSGEHRHPLPKLGGGLCRLCNNPSPSLGSPPFTSRWAAPWK